MGCVEQEDASEDLKRQLKDAKHALDLEQNRRETAEDREKEASRSQNSLSTNKRDLENKIWSGHFSSTLTLTCVGGVWVLFGLHAATQYSAFVASCAAIESA